MAIKSKFIIFDTISNFKSSNGINNKTTATNGYYENVPEGAVVFIKDTGLIWFHGTYFGIDTSLTYATQSWVTSQGYTKNTGTVTSIATGAGLTGGIITTSGTIKANLVHETKASFATSETPSNRVTGKSYPVSLDSNGKLMVYVPWTDNNTTSFTITANATDGLWDITGTNGTNAVTYAVGAYSSQQSKASFDTSSTAPTRSDRLNYNGYLYATKLFSGGVEVLTSHQSLANYLPLSGGTITGNLTVNGSTTLKKYIIINPYDSSYGSNPIQLYWNDVKHTIVGNTKLDGTNNTAVDFLHSGNTSSASSSAISLSFGGTSTLATINGVDVKVSLPAASTIDADRVDSYHINDESPYQYTLYTSTGYSTSTRYCTILLEKSYFNKLLIRLLYRNSNDEYARIVIKLHISSVIEVSSNLTQYVLNIYYVLSENKIVLLFPAPNNSVISDSNIRVALQYNSLYITPYNGIVSAYWTVGKYASNLLTAVSSGILHVVIGNRMIKGSMIPYTPNTYDLGSSTYIWNYLYANNLSDGTNSLTVANIKSTYDWYLIMTTGNTDGTINKWKEIESFVNGISDTSTLNGILAGKANMYSYTIGGGKTVRITYDSYQLVIISVSGSNKGGLLVLIGSGYGEEGAVRNKFTEVVSCSTSMFTWSLPASSSISRSIEIHSNRTNDSTITVISTGSITFTEISALTTAALNAPLATENWVTSQGYITSHQSLSGYLPLSGGTMTGENPILFATNTIALSFRTNDHASYDSKVEYMTNGNEALVFSNKAAITSFIFKCGYSLANSSNWYSSAIGVPTVLMKNQSLYVNGAIDSGVTPAYNFYVGGTGYISSNFSVNELLSVTGAATFNNNVTIRGTLIDLPGLGEGFKIHSDNNYFGSNLDGVLFTIKDSNQAVGVDGGIVFRSEAINNGTVTATDWLIMRYAGSNYGTFTWLGKNILHAGNTYISNGVITINGTNITPLTSHQSLANYLPLSGGTLTGYLGYNSLYLPIVKGGVYITSIDAHTGCLTISLPADIGNAMTSMWIDVYNYSTGTSFSVHIGGYTYNSSTWQHNPAVMVYGALHRVRLGYNNGFKIYIGETNSTWHYPQVVVKDVICGYNGAYSKIINSWSISFETSLPTIPDNANRVEYAWTTRNFNPSNYVTSITTNGDYLRWVKNGINNDITVPYATKSSHLIEKDDVTYGWNGLLYFNSSISSVGTATTNGCPTNNWYHIIRMNHANTNGYFTDIACGINTHDMWYRRINNGGVTSQGWTRILDSNNTYINNGTITINGTSITPVTTSGITGYYWADVKISNQSSTNTYPTFAGVNTTAIHARHLDAALNSVNADHNLYIGYGSGGYTLHTYFYYSTGTSGTNTRTSNSLQATVDVNGFNVTNHLSIGTDLSSYDTTRAELDVISATDTPCDIWLGVNKTRYWYLSARDSTGNYNLQIGRTSGSGIVNFSSVSVSAVDFTATSDIRLKRDIQQISDHIYSFRFKDSDKIHYGFIALELEKEHPDLVGLSEYKTVNYNSALSLYVAELENRVKMLENEINNLKNK